MSVGEGAPEGPAPGSPSTPARKLSARLAKFAYSPKTPEGKTRRAAIGNASAASAIPSPSPRKKARRSLAADGHTPESTTSSPGPAQSVRNGNEDSDELQAVTPSKRKPKKVPRGYAAPETYDHLLGIPDYLAPGLSVIFCGIKWVFHQKRICLLLIVPSALLSPGKMSSIRQHHFAHPSNKFWKALADSGFTDRLRACGVDDALCTEMFGFGLTNLVPRVTSEQAELSTAEMRQCVPLLLQKLDTHRPRVCCFVGKKIWDVFESVIKKSAKAAELGHSSGTCERSSDTALATGPLVKLEDFDIKAEARCTVNFKPIPPPGPDEANIQPADGASPSPRKFGTSNSVTFGWDQPRAFVLPHAEEARENSELDVKTSRPRYTMFWVVPSTSGLERTPYAELVRHFRNLKKLADLLEHNDLDLRIFRHIDVEGVLKTVEEIKSKEAEKAAAKAEV